ncbi:hypothetical protein B7494_g633 [Chlorociboria aeruginascens]|nr:hypothetical protein B7494_g633 [Chlorociboria aeruginascens]
MTWKPGDSREWELPHLREAHQLPSANSDFWSVKFYPYSKPGVDPVFAIIAEKQASITTPTSAHVLLTQYMQTLICRTPIAGKEGASMQVIQAIVDQEPNAENYACTWSKDSKTGTPLLCVSGGTAKIKVVNALTGEVQQTLTGHGGWTLPEFPDKNTGTDNPTLIHYPHFSTSEVHLGMVDCIAFHNSLILSKAHDEQYPSLAPTTHDAQRDSRSAFSQATTTTDHFTRLLKFTVPDCKIMFMRFSLLPGSASSNPVLAMVNNVSKVFFWDLKRLEEFFEYTAALPSEDTNAQPSTAAIEPRRPPFLVPFRHRARGGRAVASNRDKDTLSRVMREASPTDSTGADSHFTGSGSSDVLDPLATENTGPKEKPLSKKEKEKSHEIWRKKYAIGDPREKLGAHKEELVKGLTFTGRHVGWSADGEWCVVVGSGAVVAIFQRWAK